MIWFMLCGAALLVAGCSAETPPVSDAQAILDAGERFRMHEGHTARIGVIEVVADDEGTRVVCGRGLSLEGALGSQVLAFAYYPDTGAYRAIPVDESNVNARIEGCPAF